jgi:AAA domain
MALEAEGARMLLEMENEIQRQLAGGTWQPERFYPLMQNGHTAPLVAAASLFNGGFPEAPSGLPLTPFPKLNQASGGLMGLWVVGGEPGVGKSTFALQLALVVGEQRPVLLYDLELGEQPILYRVSMMCGLDLARVRRLTARLYIREDIRQLDGDLATLAQPCVVLVDSLQKLPVKAGVGREGLEQWLQRLEGLAKRGHAVICVSELNRLSYGKPPSPGVWKASGEIEYSAWFALHLMADPLDKTLTMHVSKNRHREQRGLIGRLYRDPDRVFLFREEGT